MGTRIITAVLGIPFAVAVLLLGGIWLKGTMLILSLIALYEIYHVITKQYKPLLGVGFGITILYYMFLSWTKSYFSVFCALIVMLLLTIMVAKYPKYSIVDITLTFLPIFYTTVLFSFVVLTRQLTHGIFWVWLIPISAWGSDTFAYFTGLTIGRHKLAPQLSPKKTIEGSIGGVIGAGVLGYMYTWFYANYSTPLFSEYTGVVVGAVMISAIWSQVGDLAASSIKRYFEEKDFGHLLPGHGGILDRFDSLLFVAPIIYIAALWAENVMK